MADRAAAPAGADASPLRGLRGGVAALAGAERVDLVALMTLVLLLVSATGGWYVRIPVSMLGAAGLLLPSLRRGGTLWLLLALALFGGYGWEWFLTDNHKFLFAYWCLALFLALRTGDPVGALAVSSRWLLALCFVFATLWKLLSPDFLDGSFFHFSFLTDTRLRGAAELLAGLPRGAGAENYRALESLTAHSVTVADLELRSSASVARAARVLAVLTVVVEGLVALVFLAPNRSRLARLRPLLLVAFVLGTYALAPVVSFGWVLLILAVAQAPAGSRAVPAYVTVFLLLPLYRIPWYELLGAWR